MNLVTFRNDTDLELDDKVQCLWDIGTIVVFETSTTNPVLVIFEKESPNFNYRLIEKVFSDWRLESSNEQMFDTHIRPHIGKFYRWCAFEELTFLRSGNPFEILIEELKSEL